MEALSAGKIAKIVGGSLLFGDGEREVTEVSTSSKQGDANTLFVPIIGERVDAHDFIKDAYTNGIRVTFTMRTTIEDETIDMTYIKVDHAVDALQRLAAFYRDQFSLPIIGITGSVGKTTTKEMIAAALSVKYSVLKTSGNMNSQVGLPQMMLKIKKEHDIAVIEMGMSMPGEMEKLVQVAKPQLAVVTNIGVSHIGCLGSKENIREAKLNIVNEFHPNAKLLVNGEDELLNQLYEAFANSEKEESNESFPTVMQENIKLSDQTRNVLARASVEAFGLNRNFEYYAKDVSNIREQTYFTFCYTNSVGTLCEEEVVLNVLGEHNVINAVVALAVAAIYNVEPSSAKAGLLNYRPISMRGEIEKMNGITLVDDTYNASPDSMKSAIDVLLALPDAKRRIAVFADILELGEISKNCHYDVGVYLADKNVDIVVTIGREASYITEALENSDTNIKTLNFSDNESASKYLLMELVKGDAIILKGSRGMQLDEVVKNIKTSFNP